MNTVSQLFKGRKNALELYEYVSQYIQSIGIVDIKVSKTQVSFVRKRSFAWVWLPQMWIKSSPEDGIVVSFSLDHEIVDKRIKEAVKPASNRWMHHVVLTKKQDFDTSVKAWLDEAFQQASN